MKKKFSESKFKEKYSYFYESKIDFKKDVLQKIIESSDEEKFKKKYQRILKKNEVSFVIVKLYTDNIVYKNNQTFYSCLNYSISSDDICDLYFRYIISQNRIAFCDKYAVKKVFRGESHNKSNFLELKNKLIEGNFVRAARCWSTSTSNSKAKEWTKNNDYSIFYEIKVPSHVIHYKAYFDEQSEYPEENEVLFVPYSLFLVKSIDFEENSLNVKLLAYDNIYGGEELENIESL
jgi:hypothetical protein